MATAAFYYALWILPALAQVWVITIMLRRGLHKRLRVFFAYTAFQVGAFAIEFPLYHVWQLGYYYLYWVAAAISVTLGFAVMCEIFHEVFQPFVGLKDFSKVLFRWAALIPVLAAILMAAARPAIHPSPYLAVILTLERSVRVMQCGLVLLMMMCSGYLGITRRHHVFGISLGFGMIAAMDLLSITVLSIFGTHANKFFVLAKLITYFAAVSVWSAYLLRPEPARTPVHSLARADQWDFALAGVSHPDTHAPAVQLIESAVDRVLQKANGEKHDAHHGE